MRPHEKDLSDACLYTDWIYFDISERYRLNLLQNLTIKNYQSLYKVH